MSPPQEVRSDVTIRPHENYGYLDKILRQRFYGCRGCLRTFALIVSAHPSCNIHVAMPCRHTLKAFAVKEM